MKPKLLIFELRMMGDAIMSLPFLRAAQAKYTIYVCCQPSVADVFRLVLPDHQIIPWRPPWLEETRKYGFKKWRQAGLGSLIRRVRQIQPQAALSVWADTRVHLLMGLSGARARLGFPMNPNNVYASQLPWRRHQIRVGKVLNTMGGMLLARRLLNRKLDRADYLQHHVEDWRQLAEALGLDWNPVKPWFNAPQVPLPSEIEAWVRSRRARGQKIWLLHPGARAPGHRWPLEKFRRLIEETFIAKGIPLLIIDPLETPLPENWVSGPPVCRPKTLPELFTLVNAVDFVVCNDTGISHVAAALDKKVVSIFSASLPQWFAPYGNLDLVAQSPVCPHQPCLERCVMPSYICLEPITVEIVRRKIEKVQGAGNS